MGVDVGATTIGVVGHSRAQVTTVGLGLTLVDQVVVGVDGCVAEIRTVAIAQTMRSHGTIAIAQTMRSHGTIAIAQTMSQTNGIAEARLGLSLALVDDVVVGADGCMAMIRSVTIASSIRRHGTVAKASTVAQTQTNGVTQSNSVAKSRLSLRLC